MIVIFIIIVIVTTTTNSNNKMMNLNPWHLDRLSNSWPLQGDNPKNHENP